MNEEDYRDDEDFGEEPEEESRGMGFLDHLEELRWTLFKCLGIFLAAVIAVAIFLVPATHLLNRPMRIAMSATGLEGQGLFMVSPMGVFSVVVQVCFLGGLGLAMPFMLFFLGRFIAPALKPEELKVLLPACAGTFFLFLGGACFSYFFLVPEALKFAIRLNVMFGFEVLWSADRYYGLLVWTVLGLGFCFQLPLVVYVLVFLRVIGTDKLRKARPYMIVLFFFLGALLTPTWDPITQSMVALPMWLLYEISLFFAAKLEAKREKEIEEALADIEEDEEWMD